MLASDYEEDHDFCFQCPDIGLDIHAIYDGELGHLRLTVIHGDALDQADEEAVQFCSKYTGFYGTWQECRMALHEAGVDWSDL